MANDWQKSGLLILALTWALGVSPVKAQNVPEAPLVEEEVVEDVRYYSVEVIVFEYASNVSAGNELFDPVAPDEPAVSGLGATTGIPVFGDTAAGSNPVANDNDAIGFGDFDDVIEEEISELTPIASLSGIEFRLLTEQELTMSGVHERLLALDAYQPVLWGGWVQATHEKEITPSIRLRMLGAPPIHIDGTLTLYLKNYLHLAVDVTREQYIAAFQPVYRMEKPARDNDRSVFNNDPEYSVTDSQTIIYHIQEDRLFNSGQLRYYDHPKFGVLARVSRVEVADPDAGDEDADRVPGRSMLSSTR